MDIKLKLIKDIDEENDMLIELASALVKRLDSKSEILPLKTDSSVKRIQTYQHLNKPKRRRRRKSSDVPINPLYRNRFTALKIHNLIPEMAENNDVFYKAYRMGKNDFFLLVTLVRDKIRKTTSQLREAIPTELRLAVCLRYLSSGITRRSVAKIYRISITAVGTIVKEGAKAIWEALQPTQLKMPTERRWLQIAEEFEKKWNYPNCIGVIDLKHIQMRCCANITMLVLIDANYKFTLLDVGIYGGKSSANIFVNSEMGAKFENDEYSVPKNETSNRLPFVIVGDAACPTRSYIMQAYTTFSTAGESTFNSECYKLRHIVENAYSLLAGRWRVFLKPFEGNSQTVQHIILATCCLHNMFRESMPQFSPFEDEIKVECDNIAMSDVLPAHTNAEPAALTARERFKEYFMNREAQTTTNYENDAEIQYAFDELS